jgi:thiamine transport system substrate-binding protein
MMTKVISEADNPWADVVIGITDDMAQKVYDANVLERYESAALSDIPAFLHFDPSYRLLPFDYGNFAFVVDTERMKAEDVPTSLASLVDPKYKNKVILIDPRTSSVGLGLLLWTIEVFGEKEYLTLVESNEGECPDDHRRMVQRLRTLYRGRGPLGAQLLHQSCLPCDL